MTNYLGLNKTSFAEDRTFNYEVWNQPIVAYEVTNQEEITLSEANELLQVKPATESDVDEDGTEVDGDEAGQSEEYSFNEDAAFFYKVAARVTYITESKASVTPAASKDFERNDYYTYILELDADRKGIVVEWYGASRKKHPDFLWNQSVHGVLLYRILTLRRCES